jgi:hypothetical protein
MTSRFDSEAVLPGADERRQILERAGVVLAQARALCETLDREGGRITWSWEQAHPALLQGRILFSQPGSPEVALRV